MMADRTQGWLLSPKERQEIADWFSMRAGAVDRCREPAQRGLEKLAERGLLAKGVRQELGGDGGDMMEMAEVIATVAGSCLTSAFVLWCHRMCVQYVVTGGNPYLIDEVLPQLLSVRRFGATGLANAMKHAAALEELRVTAALDEGRLILSGSLPWVSNLVDDRFVVAVAARLGDKSVLVAVPGDAPGVAAGPRFPLFGLEGTISASLALDRVSLDERWVISKDGAAFLAQVRPVFLLLQSALAWGLAESALKSAAAKLAGPRVILKDRVEQLTRELDRLVGELRTLAAGDLAGHRVYRALRARKELAELAVAAVWLELEAAGGAGYLSESETARRLREAAFFPVQSPSLVHLRAELAQYEALPERAPALGRAVEGGAL